MDDKLENQNWTPFLLILKVRCLFVKYNTVILMKKFKSFKMGFQYQLKENWKLSLSNLISVAGFSHWYEKIYCHYWQEKHETKYLRMDQVKFLEDSL